jgi:endonuclease III
MPIIVKKARSTSADTKRGAKKESTTSQKPTNKAAPAVKPVAKTKKNTGAGKAISAKGTAPKSKFKKVSVGDAQKIMDLLCSRYPDAECELTFRNDFELLIAVILSAQTTDANVNRATPKLFAKFPDAVSLATAPIEEVKELVRSTGYYNAKANNIQACARGLVERFGGKVPATVAELTTLPGVGRKTANVVLGVVHDIPGWTVDTHVQRLSKRLGFSEQEDPAKIEKDLQKLFPERDWTKYSITLIWHGRRCCEARNPDCAACPVNHLCPSSLV